MIWRTWKFWVVLLAATTVIGLLEGLQVYVGTAASGRVVSWSAAFGSTMPSWYVLLALLPGVIWAAGRFPLEASRWRRSLAVHLLAASVFAFLHIGTASWLSDYVLKSHGEMPFGFGTNLSRLMAYYFVIELVTYFALIGAHHAYTYAHRSRAREKASAQLALKATRLEASLARANLESLRMQLNPHFLFNTLNAISVMALKGDRHGVVRMLTLLSELLRQTLENRQQVVSLREELAFLDRYVEIEQVRFRDRLTVQRDIDVEALDAEVPSLLLQPLVENAIGHGLSRTPGPGTITIEAAIEEGEVLQLRVLDTGPGFMDGRRPGPVRTGLGIANTRARLEQLYGSRQEIVLANRPEGGAAVTVRLPLRIFSHEPVYEEPRSVSA